MRHTLSPVRSLWYSQIDLTGNTGWGLANVLQTCLCLSSSKYVEKTKNMLRLKSTSCLAEVRLFCSGACRVLGLWATSLCLVTELPCLWPLGIFSTVPFTWSLPALRSCRTPQGSSPSCCDHLICHGRMPLTRTSWITRVKFQRDGRRRTLGRQFCFILMINQSVIKRLTGADQLAEKC